jgi:Nucleotidyltransferase domain
MDTKEYLNGVLQSQNFADDSQELKDLQTHRKKVESILCEGFPEATKTIQYGGSKAKGTLNKESYDLDVICYFASDDTSAGVTLKEVFDNVSKKLSEDYYVEQKTSSVRLKDKDNKIDFHIDVVPGRYVDESNSDCFIYQNGADKQRLKTNLAVHVGYVRDSGVVPAIRLVKLWKARRGLRIKQFALELLIIKLLEGKKNSSLEAQVKHVWTSIADAKEPIAVEDPANPFGNDLSEVLKAMWPELSQRAQDTLDLLARSGWEAVFGPLEKGETDNGAKTSVFVRAGASVTTPTKPWLP